LAFALDLLISTYFFEEKQFSGSLLDSPGNKLRLPKIKLKNQYKTSINRGARKKNS